MIKLPINSIGFSSEDEGSIEQNRYIDKEEEDKKRSARMSCSHSTGSHGRTIPLPKGGNSRTSLNQTNSPPSLSPGRSRHNSESSGAPSNFSSASTPKLSGKQQQDALGKSDSCDSLFRRDKKKSEEKKKFKRKGSASSNHETTTTDESSLDDETKAFIEREDAECNTLDSQAEFIRGALKKVIKNRESIVMISEDVPFFEQKLSSSEFCVTEPSSACGTPRKSISSDLSAKTRQDLNDMRMKLDYMTQQMQNINNKYVAIQEEMTEIKKSQASSSGCGGCLF